MKSLMLLSIFGAALAISTEWLEHGLNYQDNENITEIERAFINFNLEKRLYFLPENRLILHYETEEKVNLGNELKVKDILEAPSVIYEADPDSFYTLMMFDVDSPNRKRPVFGDLALWLIVNIPGSKIQKGDTVIGYTPVLPSKMSGAHRVVFLLFKQHHKQVFNEEYVPSRFSPFDKRVGFSPVKFAMKYRLGRPIAGNFFQLEHDNSFANDVIRHYGPHHHNIHNQDHLKPLPTTVNKE